MTVGNYTQIFQTNNNYTRLHQKIKNDPYRHILSKREFEKTYNRFKRLCFSGGLIGAYLYYNIRYHQELGLVKKFKFSRNFYYQCVPKVVVIGLFSYLFGYGWLNDFEKRRRHQIAKWELMKFDPEYFTYDDHRYTFANSAVHSSPDSKRGVHHPLRGFFNYFQEAGYITRLRERNPDIIKEVPPKYDFTPTSPRAGEDFEGKKNKIPAILKTL